MIVSRLSRSDREVALKEDLLLGDVRDQQAVGVRGPGHVVHLDCSRSIRVDLLLRNGFDLCRLRILGKGVIQQRSGSIERSLEKHLVVLLRDDCCAFGHHRRQSSGVIGVRMRVHDVTNRLVGDELLRFGDVSESTPLDVWSGALSGLEHHDVVFELHDHRVVTGASCGEPVKAVAKLFRSDGQTLGATAWAAAWSPTTWSATAWSGRSSGSTTLTTSACAAASGCRWR